MATVLQELLQVEMQNGKYDTQCDNKRSGRGRRISRKEVTLSVQRKESTG